jgi:hypothetical protein
LLTNTSHIVSISFTDLIYWYSFLRVKQPGREVGHLAPSIAEVKNEWRYTSLPPVCLHGMTGTTLQLLVYCLLKDSVSVADSAIECNKDW